VRPDIDIPIVFTGARPGEKLFEDILSAEEGTTSTKHDRVFVARVGQRLTRHEFEQHLNALTQAVKSGDKEDVIGAIAALVTSYQPEGQCRVGEPVPA
jgi:FlaA1/EpsC-like NDP-sugar epimerase